MSYQFEEINRRAARDPRGLIEEGDALYTRRVEQAAELIAANRARSPIVLLSGPSASGKTTTSKKIAQALERRGIYSHYVAMDDYFVTVDMDTVPRTPEGEPDFESPLCLDMELLNEHFSRLSRGETIHVPKFEFTLKRRVEEPSKTICPGRDEMVIFEGIHALNDMITRCHGEAFKLYISTESELLSGSEVLCSREALRLARRTVRDALFRAIPPSVTAAMWANVCRGERLYISPFKGKADFGFDTALIYELPVLAARLAAADEGQPTEELQQLTGILRRFAPIDEKLVPADSLLREFIGGGIYN